VWPGSAERQAKKRAASEARERESRERMEEFQAKQRLRKEAAQRFAVRSSLSWRQHEPGMVRWRKAAREEGKELLRRWRESRECIDDMSDVTMEDELDKALLPGPEARGGAMNTAALKTVCVQRDV
jgi:hypothetical protein